VIGKELFAIFLGFYYFEDYCGVGSWCAGFCDSGCMVVSGQVKGQ